MARVAIAAGSRIAADAGASAAANGGNAVDAAISASLASMVTDPGIISLGAGSFVTIWPAGGDPVVIDAYAEMPGRGAPPNRFGAATDEVYMAYGGGMTTIVGYGSIATPGSIAGFGLANREYGRLRWADLFEPSIHWAERGFPLSGAAAEYMTYAHDVIYGWEEASRYALHHEDGKPLGEGEIVHLPGFAESLQMLADGGPSTFYTGELGRAMAEMITANGGLLSQADLDAYEAIVRTPIMVPVGDWSLASNPAPAVGGAAVAAALLLITGGADAWDANSVAHIAESLRHVFGYRADVLEVAEDRDEATAVLLAAAREGDMEALRNSQSTIHVSAVDEDGLACAISTSAGYGSGATIPGTGIWLNNSLGEVELNPGGLHFLQPGSRLLSNMAPTIARAEDESVLAVGSPGASRITSAVTLVLYNALRMGMPLEAAVHQPRLHPEMFDGKATLAVEPDVDISKVDGLTIRQFDTEHMYFGGVQAAMWSPVSGLEAAADHRRSGATAIAG